MCGVSSEGISCNCTAPHFKQMICGTKARYALVGFRVSRETCSNTNRFFTSHLYVHTNISTKYSPEKSPTDPYSAIFLQNSMRSLADDLLTIISGAHLCKVRTTQPLHKYSDATVKNNLCTEMCFRELCLINTAKSNGRQTLCSTNPMFNTDTTSQPATNHMLAR